MAKKITDKEKELRTKALNETIKNIDKNFGSGTIMRLGDKEHMDIEAISTGSLAIDEATGIGGVPVGRIVEIYGPESSGKTTLTLQIVAEAQKEGKTCAFIDAEHALDIEYAKKLGVDIDNILVSQPDYGEQGLEILDALTKSGAVDLVIVDSVAALTPKSEIEGEMGDQNVGVQARLMSKALRKVTGFANQNNCTIIFINQIRMKIGMMGYGSPETTTGGNALKFYASMRIDIRSVGAIKKGDEQIGKKTKVKIIKNKVAAPFKIAETEIRFGEGFSKYAEVLSYAVKYDIINKSGSWYSYENDKLGQGDTKVFAFFEEKPEMFEEIRNKVISKMNEK